MGNNKSEKIGGKKYGKKSQNQIAWKRKHLVTLEVSHFLLSGWTLVILIAEFDEIVNKDPSFFCVCVCAKAVLLGH